MPHRSLSDRIDQGRGLVPADLVLKGGRVFDLITGDLVETDVAICGDTIVGVFGTYRGQREIDVSGRVLVPGFIDTHLHIESSLVTPHEFDRCVTPRGVTTAICDPHENCQCLRPDRHPLFPGVRGPDPDGRKGAAVQLRALDPHGNHGRAAGSGGSGAADGPPQGDRLAEFMNYPGVLMKDAGCLAKLEAFRGRHIDGHAPLLRGLDLNGYISAGIRTEHEATTAEEGLEKLRKGCGC